MNNEEFTEKINDFNASLDKLDHDFSERFVELEQKINELKEQFKEQPQEEYKRWRAGTSEEFWQLGTCTTTLPVRCVETDDNYIFHTEMYDFGNHFKSLEDAENCRNNLITKQKLKDLALRLNKGVEIDWEDDRQNKYCIYYDYGEKMCFLNWQQISRSQGTVYCLDENFLEIAKQEIGEEKLIELIKSGV